MNDIYLEFANKHGIDRKIAKTACMLGVHSKDEDESIKKAFENHRESCLGIINDCEGKIKLFSDEGNLDFSIIYRKESRRWQSKLQTLNQEEILYLLRKK